MLCSSKNAWGNREEYTASLMYVFLNHNTPFSPPSPKQVTMSGSPSKSISATKSSADTAKLEVEKLRVEPVLKMLASTTKDQDKQTTITAATRAFRLMARRALIFEGCAALAGFSLCSMRGLLGKLFFILVFLFLFLYLETLFLRLRCSLCPLFETLSQSRKSVIILLRFVMTLGLGVDVEVVLRTKESSS